MADIVISDAEWLDETTFISETIGLRPAPITVDINGELFTVIAVLQEDDTIQFFVEE